MSAKKRKEYFKILLSQRLDGLLTEAKKTASGMTDFRNQSPDPLDRAFIESHTTFAFRIKERECVLIRKIE
jgi:DnaK suppressor protein